MRLDAYLAEKNIYDSRTRAARAIKEGFIEDSIFCKYCGSNIDCDSKFCKHCGKKQ